MEKQIVKSDKLQSSYSVIKHSSGLTVYIWKMEGYATTQAAFTTNYGSVNTCFKTTKTGEFITVPEGIAHYLEHKLFENEDSDVFELYAKTGANGNAFTSFDSTSYVFSCTENWEDSLKILLDFVQKPYFTKESVAKEQGIIGQEIKMCQDSPDRQCFFNLLKALFVNHPVKIDIAGTVESIAQITPELLYDCYYTFYNLNNMVLCLAGNVDEDKAMKIVDELCKPAENLKLETKFPAEPLEVDKKEIYQSFPVGLPLFNIGFKAKPTTGAEYEKNSLIASILMQIIAGQTSSLYQQLFEEGLINSQFNVSLFCGESYFTSIFAGESREPKLVYKRICNEIERLKKEGINEEEFEIHRKAKYGGFVRALTDPEFCIDAMNMAYANKTSAFGRIDILADITLEDCNKALDELFKSEYSAISIVDSNERNEN